MADDQAPGEVSLLDEIKAILLPEWSEDDDYDTYELVLGTGKVVDTLRIPKGQKWEFISLPPNPRS